MNRLLRQSTQATLLAFVVVTACSKSDAPPADSSAAKLAQGAAPIPKVMPGALTKPIDAYSADEFYDLVQKQLYVGAHEQERPCKEKPGCVTKVVVDAIATQDSLSLGTTPQYGVVYIHGVNKGDAVEARYGLKPGARYQYYWIITTDSSKKGMQWQLEELDTTPNARKLASVGSGPFAGCNHPYVAGARADFKTCEKAAAYTGNSVVHLGLMLQGSIGDPVWASCAEGCCRDSGDGGPGGPPDTTVGSVRGRGRGTGKPPR
ncbi:MAG: hypothetical protein JWM95_4178 [Gemmatimonadetes bacterium]|nr:hypothetical protein [Gemmatimonadota bacterium]